MEQKNKNKFCTLETKIIITIVLIILGFLGFFAINTYGIISQNTHEETLVRMATSLAKGENFSNTVNLNLLTNNLNKYVGNTMVTIQEVATDLLNIQFNNTGNLYQINIVTGFVEWIQNLTYKITYNANGGIMLPYIQFAKPDQGITLTNFKPTRAGYTFLGWSTNSNDTTPEYASKGIYVGANDTILYAIWEQNIILETYAVTYNANGGSGTPETQRITHGESFTIPNIEPTRQGCEFLGWSTNSNASTPTYIKGQTYPINSSMALYAVWKVNGYTVTYYPNGGSGEPSPQTVEHDGSITVSAIKPGKMGHEFVGWDISSAAETVIYEPNDTISNIIGNINLYAVWEINQYTVTYYANEGSNVPNAETVNYGGNITISTTIPTRDGYEFAGWDTSSAAGTVIYEPNDTIENISANINLYAVWGEMAVQYTITFDPNSGTGAPAAITVNEGESVTIPDNVPTRSGGTAYTTYSFVGWSKTQKTASATVTADYAPGETIPASEINGDMPLYATYHSQSSYGIGTKYYVVLFNQNGGSKGPIALRVQQRQAGTIPTTTPTKEGYTFLGWSTTQNATTATNAAGTSITPTGNMTLYAVWGENGTGTGTYTVSFTKATSTTWNSYTVTNLPESITVTSGGSITIPNVTPTCKYNYGTTRTYTFIGWSTTTPSVPSYTTSNPTAEYSIGDTISNITSEIKLYPVFKRNS